MKKTDKFGFRYFRNKFPNAKKGSLVETIKKSLFHKYLAVALEQFFLSFEKSPCWILFLYFLEYSLETATGGVL